MTMKKLVFGFLPLLVPGFSVQAQECPARAVKKAGNALKAFQLDPTANMDKLHEAVDMISIAAAADEVADAASTNKSHFALSAFVVNG